MLENIKKVLFITNFNNVVREISVSLMDYFQVQMCEANVESVKGMLSMFSPDVILIGLTGFDEREEAMFTVIQSKMGGVPVLTIGTEYESKICEAYYKSRGYQKLLRPIQLDDVLEALFVMLKLDPSKERERVSKSKDNRKHILCVDDDGLTLRKLKELIGSNYRVSVVTSGTKAITMIERDRPDLIFLDYEMPVVDGKMTLEMIRSEMTMKDIPVVFITGRNDKESIQAVLNLRPAGYILKPPVQVQIEEIIKKILPDEEE